MNFENIKTYVINLDRRTDRISDLKIPLAWERFSATDGKEKYSNKPIKERGWRGCQDSHIRLLEKIINENEDIFIVFEDDVEVGENFMNNLKSVVESLPTDWDLLFLGGWNVGEKIKFNDLTDIAKSVYCTHAYMFKKDVAKKMLNKFKEREFKVDVLLAELLPSINAYICNPTIAWQRPGFSDVENIVTNNIHLK
jgi:GR25 family glycosyltransferase involved in LPS biosynthesis